MGRIYRTSLETQNRAIRLVDEYQEKAKSGAGLGLDLQNLISDFKEIPITPVIGGLVTILGYTGHCKTTFSKMILNSFIETLSDPNDIVVYINYEESLEELAIKDVSRLSHVRQASIIRGEITDDESANIRRVSTIESSKPVWVIADSIYDTEYDEQPTLKTITEQLMQIKNKEGKNIRLVVIDYFQIIPLMIKNPSREGHARNAVYLQRLGNMLGCPIIVLSQTNRNPQDRGIKIPKLFDAAETSAIEKSSRAVYAVYLPWKDNEELGGTININGKNYTVTPDLFIIRLLKQKHNPDPITIVTHMDFDNMRLLPISKFE